MEQEEVLSEATEFRNCTSEDFNLHDVETSNEQIILYCGHAGYFMYTDDFMYNIPTKLQEVINDLEKSDKLMIRKNEYLVIRLKYEDNIKTVKFDEFKTVDFSKENFLDGEVIKLRDFIIPDDSKYLIFSNLTHEEDSIANSLLTSMKVNQLTDSHFLAVYPRCDGFARVTLKEGVVNVEYSSSEF